MTGKERLQTADAGTMNLNGLVANLTGIDVAMVNSLVPEGRWAHFVPEEARPTVTLVTMAPVGQPEESEATIDAIGQEKAPLQWLLRWPFYMEGEMEEIGRLNDVYRLVKPKQPCLEMEAYWRQCLEQFGSGMRLSYVPRASQGLKSSTLGWYYIVPPGAVFVGAMRHCVRSFELERWLVPADPLFGDDGKLRGIRSLVPACYLLSEVDAF